MRGKTEQVQTTGANLFDTSKTKIKFDNMSIWAKQCFDNAFITTTFKPNTKYYVKCKITMLSAVKNKKDFDMKKSIVLYNAKASRTVEIINHKSKMNDNETFVYSSSFTTPEDLTGYIINAYTERYTEQDGTGEYLSTIRIDDIIVSENNIPFEPYSGGFPSPSPDWKQPIEVTDKPVTVIIKSGTEQQSITLVPPRPLTKWDKLEKIDGVWQWVYQSKICMLSDIATEWVYFTVGGIKQYYFSCNDCFFEENKNNIYADKFKSWTIEKRENNYGTVYLGKDAICFNVDKFSTLENWKDWVSANPVNILYKTKETEYIPLLQSEQPKLNSLTMYAPTTEITNDGGCNMELTYTVDTKSYVDTKIAEISKAIL